MRQPERTATIGENQKDITSYIPNCPPHAIDANRGGQLPLFAGRDRTRCKTADQLAPATTDCPASVGIAVAYGPCVTRLTAYSADGGAPAIRLSLSRARLRRDI